MSYVNKFLDFAGDVAASVQTDSVYAADGQRTTGMQPGVFRGVFVNKALRQAARMASGIAAYLLPFRGADMVDTITDGELAAAINAAMDARIVPARGNYRDVVLAPMSGSTPRAITADDAGKLFLISNASDDNCIIQLPSLSATGMYSGATFTFTGAGVGYNKPPYFYSVTGDSALWIWRNFVTIYSVWTGGDLTWTFQVIADPVNSKWIMVILDCPTIPT